MLSASGAARPKTCLQGGGVLELTRNDVLYPATPLALNYFARVSPA